MSHRTMKIRFGLFSAFLALTLLFSAQCAVAHPDHGVQPSPQAPALAPHDHHHPQPNETAPAKPDCCPEETIDCCQDLKATPQKAELKPAQGPLVALAPVAAPWPPAQPQVVTALHQKAPPGPATTPVSLKQVQLH